MMIPKPADTHWTDDQWKAISLYDQNLLIAAAAGSGKTAVLVERIIRRISAENNPIDVDRLLVATFTKAAADEMRQRIREALEEKLLQTPDSQHLRRQLALIHRASITTLHSFCLEVVQRYFQVVQIDPGFRIGNETEMELMRQDALEELFEEYYADSEEGSNFWKLVDAYSGERSDDALYKLVLQLYDYSRSHPWPDHWLLEMAEIFEQSEVETSHNSDNIWYQSLLEDVRLELVGALGLLGEAVQLCGQTDGPDAYLETLQEDLTQVEQLYDVSYEQTWSDVYHAFQALDFARLKAAKGDYINKDVQDKVKGLRDTVKKQLLGLKEECFERSPETFTEEMKTMAPLMKTLVQLVIAFSNRYRETKAAKSLVDFSDLEHYCLQILRHADSTPDQLIPSQAAVEYQNQFVEVLLDEYQDTNRVQEAIVSLISKQSPGNRFMVGDVKQSIYRFRLAEPALFLQKYKAYRDDDGDINSEMDGRKIDLAQNFRSRSEVVDGVNFIFKQMMQETVGEIAYDDKAALVFGADYPKLEEQDVSDCSIELMLIDKASSINDEEGYTEEASSEEGQETDDDSLYSARNLETVQMEARLMASQIKRLMGREGMSFQVFDKKIGGSRPVTYRDIVILLRATQHWAPIIMDEFRQAGIPCYADLNTGYFSAGEIEIILSLLRVIDNPLQEISLAAVLRSPIYQLSAEDLAQIRIPSKGESFYQAVLNYAEAKEVYNAALQNKLKQFLEQLERWRTEARQGSLSELIWEIYRETGYFDLVGGMAGGTQRQANLRALYDRARQYEATSFRGLFRFLRFIERMKDSGGDLGTARALGEQEDVVRIMSIHKSKGLEFPIVFVAGLSKMFNRQDLNGNFLMHKQLGFGPKFIDTELRVSYPTLPSIAIKRRMRMEMLAEEMRVLYVALTRAKEKLFLIGTVKSLEKQLQIWGSSLDCPEWELPDYVLAKASCYMDWLGPALIRHPQAEILRSRMNLSLNSGGKIINEDSSRWKVSIVPSDGFDQAAAAQEDRDASVLNAIANTNRLDGQPTHRQAELTERMAWQYPYQQAETYFSKTSVSEMKRMEGIEKMQEVVNQEEAAADSLLGESIKFQNVLLRRPRFMEEKKMTAAERGTLYHAVMQHIPIQQKITSEMIVQSIEEMIEKQLLTTEQSNHIDVSIIQSFFTSELGMKLLDSKHVNREVPFSFGIPAGEVYPQADEHTADEIVMIQGVIDCLFEVEGGFILLDYKTDAVYKNSIEDIRERYRLQMDIYAKAVESIWKQPVTEKVLFLFDGGHIVSM